MRIELQEPLFARERLHDLGARPADAAALPPVDFDDPKPAIRRKRQARLLRPVLPADAKSQIVGTRGLGQAVLDGRHQLWIPVRSDGDEDQCSALLPVVVRMTRLTPLHAMHITATCSACVGSSTRRSTGEMSVAFTSSLSVL